VTADHLDGFAAQEEVTRLVHLIEHGHLLTGELRAMPAAELATLHDADHCGRDGDALPDPPDLAAMADKAVGLAAGMREHMAAGRWAEVLACADWLAEIGLTVKSHVWAAQPEARPERW
jgi:hypothetical protein